MSTAFILVGGAITYRHTPPDSPHIAAEAQQVQMGQWICEAALWVEWTCVGKAETSASCQLLAVNSEASGVPGCCTPCVRSAKHPF